MDVFIYQFDMECEKINEIYNKLELSLKTIKSDLVVKKGNYDINISFDTDPSRKELARIHTLLRRYAKIFRKNIDNDVCIGMDIRF